MNLNTTNTFYDSKQKIWSGPQREDKYDLNVTLGEAILETLQRHPGKVVQIMDPSGEEVTAAELIRDSEILTRYLMKCGLKPGDVVGLYACNSKNVTSLLIATLLCGTPWQAVFAGFCKDSVKDAFEITNPKIIFCDVENYETLKLAAVEFNFAGKVVIINGVLKDLESVEKILNNEELLHGEINYPCANLKGDITAIVLCTSGTTGSPKGVCCSHSTLLNNPVFLNISEDAILMTFSPYFWISCVFVFTASLLNGATRVITTRPYTPETFVEIIEKYSVTHVLAPTTHLAQLVQNTPPNTPARLASLRSLLYGGSKVPKMIPEKFCEILSPELEHNILYGLSEVGGIVSGTFRSSEQSRNDCEGKLMPNIKAKILDPMTGVPLGPNKVGILHISTAYKWPGYYNAAEATKKTYVNGWIRSGDLASFDDEGFLTVFERESDVFKMRNFQIYPNNLEKVIQEVDGVAEVCIFPIPDAIDENLIACAVVRSDDKTGKALTEEDITKSIERKFSSVFYLKGGVYFLDELPKTVSGKLLRRKVINIVKGLGN